jgi:hypothetical protein
VSSLKNTSRSNERENFAKIFASAAQFVTRRDYATIQTLCSTHRVQPCNFAKSRCLRKFRDYQNGTIGNLLNRSRRSAFPDQRGLRTLSGRANRRRVRSDAQAMLGS